MKFQKIITFMGNANSWQEPYQVLLTHLRESDYVLTDLYDKLSISPIIATKVCNNLDADIVLYFTLVMTSYSEYEYCKYSIFVSCDEEEEVNKICFSFIGCKTKIYFS